MTAPGWPVVLRERVGGEQVVCRPLRLHDATSWVEVRRRNQEWLEPWEPTPPLMPPQLSWAERNTVGVFLRVRHRLATEARAGRCYPFALQFGDRLVGQLTVNNVVRGAFHSGFAGYWLDQRVAGRGVMPTALAMVVDHLFGPGELHRIEANIRPENEPSLQVVRKLGFREEACHRRYLAIDGEWRDHLGFALTVEDVPGGLLRRWRAARDLH